MLLFLLACIDLSEEKCKASKNRIDSIAAQKEVLLDLRTIDKISKKKFNTINNVLSEELLLERNRYSARCKNENKK